MREEEMHVFLHTNDGSYIKLVATQPHWSSSLHVAGSWVQD